jgi:hypothetical protein
VNLRGQDNLPKKALTADALFQKVNPRSERPCAGGSVVSALSEIQIRKKRKPEISKNRIRCSV